MEIWEKYFLARYDCKSDELIGTYENLNEAIKKVYGYDRKNPKYKNAQNAIIACYQNSPIKYRKRRTARGIWYKLER